MKFNVERLIQIAEPLSEEEIQERKFRRENSEWLKFSASMALKIRKILRQQGITQLELARRMDTSACQVNKLLSGKANFELKTIFAIQEALHTPLISLA
ncbi:MAG: helix-turn-helix transcriptional regulator [Bacteroidales bacterium]|nr:helix-turn-helix transcriptional regulator [Bacteroidales bacterium]